jgi:peptidoglycan hydrolase CwlO-like protein
MYMVKCSRSNQDKETKSIIRKAKKNIDSGMDWREAIKEAESITDSIQRAKAIKSIIDYL